MKLKNLRNRYVPVLFAGLFFITGGLWAQNPPVEDDWRIIVAGAAGKVDIDIRTNLPFTYLNTTSGKSINSGLGIITGLTTTGTLPLETRATGDVQGGVVAIQNKNWTITGTHRRVEADFGPFPHGNLLPVSTMEGDYRTNVNQAQIQYRLTALSETFVPSFQYRYTAHQSSYKWRNLVGLSSTNNDYYSLPVVDADDKSSSNAVRAGLIMNTSFGLSVEPYLHFTWARYHNNIRASTGAVSTQTNLIPDNPQGLVDALYYKNVGDIYSIYAMSQTIRDDPSLGLKLQMKFARFFITNLDVRRNMRKNAWNIGLYTILMFHENFGLSANAVYVEPELNNLSARTWIIGPLATFTF